MSDQPTNEEFHASSFMQGHNAEYLEQLQAKYASNPSSVGVHWASFFSDLGDESKDL
jgi:2-oxoglutarate dehydrogenase E1 component